MNRHPAQSKPKSAGIKRTLGGITRRIGATGAKRKHGGKSR
jgi:hypothetical protein